jgi:hypothetical protein
LYFQKWSRHFPRWRSGRSPCGPSDSAARRQSLDSPRFGSLRSWRLGQRFSFSAIPPVTAASDSARITRAGFESSYVGPHFMALALGRGEWPANSGKLGYAHAFAAPR